MTTLKYKDPGDGLWKLIPITGPPGAGVPAGGALGDVLIKQSATDRDTRWGSNPPKFILTSDASQFGQSLTLNDSTHATSRRAGIRLGSNWLIAQDSAGNGTKDFILYNDTALATMFSINAAGNVITLGSNVASTTIDIGRTTGCVVRLGPTSAGQVWIGNDAYFVDVDAANTLGIRGGSDSARGELVLGSNNGIRVWGNAGAPNAGITCTGALYYDGSQHHFRNVGGGTTLFNYDGTAFNVNTNLWVNGGDIYSGINRFVQIRGTSNVLLWSDYSGGWTMSDATWMRLYNSKSITFGGGVVALAGGQMRLRSDISDSNHHLRHSTDSAATIDPGSGVASDGPWLQGWTTVVLRAASTSRSFLFESGGSCFIPSVGGYNKFSSRELKDGIEPLDPADSLAMVRRWQPVRYTMRDDGTPQEGFIAEDMHAVTPMAVNVTAPDAERPNWPNAIDYGQLTVWLTGAVQALADRIDALEEAA